MSIKDLGWDAYFEALWNGCERSACVPGRVVSLHRGLWRVAGDFEECWAEPSGRLRLEAETGEDWPAVGDWVAVELSGKGSSAIVENVLARKSRFVRKAAGRAMIQQVIAANIDVALVVAALDGDFNLRRIERYVAQCWESGARPLILLNKADACANAEELAARVEKMAFGAEVAVVSAKTGDGVDALTASFVKGKTIVLLGSSGAGKSTLVNRFLCEDRQATKPVREDDSRGQHTTTARELFVLPAGAMVIDTPGLRELGLWDAGEGISQAFADIEELAELCRFRDCRHESEPGCAVRAAIEAGTLDAGRLENRRKLEREQEFLQRKMDPEKQHEYKKRIKILFRAIRQDAQSRIKDKT